MYALINPSTRTIITTGNQQYIERLRDTWNKASDRKIEAHPIEMRLRQ
jgi:hypothetical protein